MKYVLVIRDANGRKESITHFLWRDALDQFMAEAKHYNLEDFELYYLEIRENTLTCPNRYARTLARLGNW